MVEGVSSILYRVQRDRKAQKGTPQATKKVIASYRRQETKDIKRVWE